MLFQELSVAFFIRIDSRWVFYLLQTVGLFAMLYLLKIVFKIMNSHKEVCDLLVCDCLHVLVKFPVHKFLNALTVNAANFICLWWLFGNQLNEVKVRFTLNDARTPAKELVFCQLVFIIFGWAIVLLQIYLTILTRVLARFEA